MKTTTAVLMATLVAWLGALPTTVAACGSDFVLGDEVGAAHPASIGVAFALHDAIGAGRLPAAESNTGAQARERADDAAHMLEQRLASAGPKLPPMALLQVESRLWTRYGAASRRHAAPDAHHDAGPADGDVVVVTGEPVLRALLDGRIGWAQAVDAGLVVVVGEPAAQTRVATVLAARFAMAGGSSLASHVASSRR